MGLHAVQKTVDVWSLILDISMYNVICRRHDDPRNGPTGDPSMVRLP